MHESSQIRKGIGVWRPDLSTRESALATGTSLLSPNRSLHLSPLANLTYNIQRMYRRGQQPVTKASAPLTSGESTVFLFIRESLQRVC